jgi:quercetin dioxygenase-like cupin family protein
VSDVRVERWHPGDGDLTERRLMRAMELEGYDVILYTYRSGTVFPEHEHSQEKCDAVLQGVLRVTVGDDVFDLAKGDRLYIPAGTRHAAQVVGEKTVVSLDGTKW